MRPIFFSPRRISSCRDGPIVISCNIPGVCVSWSINKLPDDPTPTGRRVKHTSFALAE